MSHLVKLLQCDSTSPSPEGKKRERSLRAGEMDAQRGVLVTEGLSGAGGGGGQGEQSPPPHDSGGHPRSDTTLFAEHVEMTLLHLSYGSQETIGATVAFWV